MLIAKRNAMSGGKARPPWLPADCVEAEYLKATYGQYIDTGVYISRDDRVRALLEQGTIDSKSSYSWAFGCELVVGYMGVQTLPTNNLLRAFRRGNTTTTQGINQPVSVLFENDGKVYFNDKLVFSGTYDITATSTLHLFAMKASYFASNVMIKSFSIDDKIDLVPVRRKTDGLGYMCDKLTGNLYGNSGTGAFIIGPDKLSDGGGYKCIRSRFSRSYGRFRASYTRLWKEAA